MSSHPARAAPSGATGSGANCLRFTPVACPSDLRALAMSGPAIHGYIDGSSGLFIEIERAFVGRVTLDEGCSSNPQYEFYLRVLLRNPQRHPVTFDWVGLTVQEQAGRIYNAFDWGGPYASHGTPLGAGRMKVAWIPYYVPKPTSLVVRWAYIYPGHTTSPQPIARYRVEPTGARACGA